MGYAPRDDVPRDDFLLRGYPCRSGRVALNGSFPKVANERARRTISVRCRCASRTTNAEIGMFIVGEMRKAISRWARVEIEPRRGEGA